MTCEVSTPQLCSVRIIILYHVEVSEQALLPHVLTRLCSSYSCFLTFFLPSLAFDALLKVMLGLKRNILWTQDWLRGTKSSRTPPPETIDEDDAVIIDRKSIIQEDEDDFVVVSNNDCKRPIDLQNTSCDDTSEDDRSYFEYDLEDYMCCPLYNGERPDDDDHESTCRKDVRLYELSGRGDYGHSFRDLRSVSKASKRDKTTRQRYYNFKHVNLGQLGAPHHQPVNLFDEDCKTPPQQQETSITKSELYRQAQLPPRPPKYHRRHIDKVYGTLSHRVDVRRENRKHGKTIMQEHLQDYEEESYGWGLDFVKPYSDSKAYGLWAFH